MFGITIRTMLKQGNGVMGRRWRCTCTKAGASWGLSVCVPCSSGYFINLPIGAVSESESRNHNIRHGQLWAALLVALSQSNARSEDLAGTCKAKDRVCAERALARWKICLRFFAFLESFSVLCKYWKVLQWYYSVLQSTTPYTKVVPSTTKYCSVLQSTTPH